MCQKIYMGNKHASFESPAEPRRRPSIQDIEDEIALLSATIAAATYRLLCLIGELDRRDGWADPLDSNGFRSCAHWLSWRVGLSLGTARQYVRIAKALPELPLVCEAFGRGEVSYSKVRAITRIATPDNEEQWLDTARCGTASHVEKLVRLTRRANVSEENDRALEHQEGRRLTTYFDSDGMLVVQGRLAPEQGALLMKALEASVDELRTDKDTSAEVSGGGQSLVNEPVAKPSGDQLWADGLVRVAERALDADAAGAASTDRYQVVLHVDAEVLASPEADGRCELENGPALAPETARRLACGGSAYVMAHGPAGELTAGRKTRVVSTTLRRALRARDGSRCSFPGCGSRGSDAHHVRSWAEGGPTVLENLTSLCRRHHTFVHEGGFRMESVVGGKFRFLRPDGQELEASPALPEVIGDARENLALGWVEPKVKLTPDTGYPEWDGEPVDYDWVLGWDETPGPGLRALG